MPNKRIMAAYRRHELSIDMNVISAAYKRFPVGFRRLKSILKQFYKYRSTTVISSLVRLLDTGALGMCNRKNDCRMQNPADRDEVFIICAFDNCDCWTGRKQAVKH